MQTLLLPPTARSAVSPAVVGLFPSHRRAPSFNIASNVGLCSPNCFSSVKTLQSSYSSSNCGGSVYSVTKLASSPVTPTFTSPIDESEHAKLAQVCLHLLASFIFIDFFVWLLKKCFFSLLKPRLSVIGLVFGLLRCILIN